MMSLLKVRMPLQKCVSLYKEITIQLQESEATLTVALIPAKRVYFVIFQLPSNLTMFLILN